MECVSNANSTNILESTNHSEAQQVESIDLHFFSDKYRDNIVSPVISDNTWTLGYITQSPSLPLSPLRQFYPQRPHYRQIAPTPTYPMLNTNGSAISGTSKPKKKRQRKARTCNRCVAISCRKCDPRACNGRQYPSKCHIVNSPASQKLK